MIEPIDVFGTFRIRREAAGVAIGEILRCSGRARGIDPYAMELLRIATSEMPAFWRPAGKVMGRIMEIMRVAATIDATQSRRSDLAHPEQCVIIDEAEPAAFDEARRLMGQEVERGLGLGRA